MANAIRAAEESPQQPGVAEFCMTQHIRTDRFSCYAMLTIQQLVCSESLLDDEATATSPGGRQWTTK